MSSHYFGFDDDATVSTSCIQKPSSPRPQRTIIKKETPQTEQLSISQIQALLCQDLTSLEGSLNSSVNETSFYTDERDYATVETLTEIATESFHQEDESSTILEEKIERRPRKVLGDIENKSEKPCNTYKKPAKIVCNNDKKETVKPPKKRKAKKENNENEENFDKFAEQINKQFAQIENFKLAVE